MKLTDAQKKWLNWLKERGGSGYVDSYGRIVAGGEVSATNHAAWINLMAKGLISGGNDRIFVVEPKE